LDLFSEPPPFAATCIDRAAGDQLHVDDRWRIVGGVFPRELVDRRVRRAACCPDRCSPGGRLR
jgi:hypothetical protein